jgi:hypothetical protein
MVLKWKKFETRLEVLRTVSSAWGAFAGNFEFADDPERSALAWFDGRREAAARFRVFGQEGSGGLYAFWLREGRQPPDAPIVLLGSEGETRVIASNEDEFLALLACDIADLGMYDDEPSGSPDHERYLAWLDEQGLSPASDPEETMVSAELAHPGLEALVAQAMAGQPIDDVVVAPTESHRATVIPTDPIALLGKPVPSVRLAKDSGLVLSHQSGRVTTVFITRGPIGSGLRPGGFEPFGLTRANAATELGAPDRADTSWDRWDLDEVAWHMTWGDDGKVEMLTLMWRPALPPYLR